MLEMDVSTSKAWEPSLRAAPRRECMRKSLDEARYETDIGRKRLARSTRFEDSSEAFDIRQAMAYGAPPPTPALLESWDRGNATNWSWASQPRNASFRYSEAKLLVGATVCDAEFEVPRRFSQETKYEPIC